MGSRLESSVHVSCEYCHKGCVLHQFHAIFFFKARGFDVSDSFYSHSTRPGPDGQGCPGYVEPLVGGCAGTRYGCCPDGVTGAQGEGGHGCPGFDGGG